MSENPLAYEKISKLLRGFAIPSITATLVSSFYNIVDQIFIGQGVGYLGNAATNRRSPNFSGSRMLSAKTMSSKRANTPQ